MLPSIRIYSDFVGKAWPAAAMKLDLFRCYLKNIDYAWVYKVINCVRVFTILIFLGHEYI